MKPRVQVVDIERLATDLLTTLMAEYEPDVTVAIGVPTDWTPESPSHLQVVSDGIGTGLYPVAGRALVRIVARAASTTEAKRLAALAEGLMLGYSDEVSISRISPVAGVLGARDPETRAELASVTVAVTARTVPISDS